MRVRTLISKAKSCATRNSEVAEHNVLDKRKVLFNFSLNYFFLGRKDFLPVEPPPQADLSFLFLLGAPRFA